MATKKAATAAEQPKLEGSNVNGDAPAERPAVPPGPAAASAEQSIETSEADAVEDPKLAYRSDTSYVGVYEDHNHVCVRTMTNDDVPPGHRYEIGNHDVGTLLEIDFQNGPIKEKGINGVQNEHLLAVLIHRTTILNDQFPCDENLIAIRHMKQAINALQARTANRQARGVEGQNKL